MPLAKSPADIPKLLRAMGRLGFMRDGRPEDYGQWPGRWKYMLDTNICVYLIERSSPELRERLAECRKGEVVVSPLALAELRYGVSIIKDAGERKKRGAAVDAMLENVPVPPFDEAAAFAYVRTRTADPARNARVFDKLIAAHAVALGLVLVTNNPKDFRKFRPALRVENWASGKR